ncbi:MAG: hypothetical protein IJX89_00200 [Alphaproteobacteria bacterium]|nr:hypothetical protein [Alphaproteobacteria bacterium]
MIKSDAPLVQVQDVARVKHRGLTGFLRHNWSRNPNVLKRIIYNTDVSPYLGALPPELRNQVPREHIAAITAEFRECLENWLIKNIFDLREMKMDQHYEIPEIGNLFGTKCTLFARGVNVYRVNPWSGLLGFVCKLSFPEINAHYALKLYYNNVSEFTRYSHGPWFEAATALAAGLAEPRDNVPMYMASLKYEKYLLSAWAGDEDKNPARDNLNKIFVTRDEEAESRNLRAGRRIDWGETYMTSYGDMPYRARKVYRQVMNRDMTAVCKSLHQACDSLARRDIARGVELARLIAWYDDDYKILDFINRIKQR